MIRRFTVAFEPDPRLKLTGPPPALEWLVQPDGHTAVDVESLMGFIAWADTESQLPPDMTDMEWEAEEWVRWECTEMAFAAATLAKSMAGCAVRPKAELHGLGMDWKMKGAKR